MCLVFMTLEVEAATSVSDKSLRSASLPLAWPLVVTPLVDDALEADRVPLLRLRWRLVLRFVSVVVEAEPATGAEAAVAGLVDEDDVLELLLLRVWGGPDSITSPICQ